jgi:hypothetical protein
VISKAHCWSGESEFVCDCVCWSGHVIFFVVFLFFFFKYCKQFYFMVKIQEQSVFLYCQEKKFLFEVKKKGKKEN